MTDLKQHLEALAELHADLSAGDRIRELIAAADSANERARALRVQAGWALVALRDRHPKDWRRRAGISSALADRLIQLTYNHRLNNHD